LFQLYSKFKLNPEWLFSFLGLSNI
jgi:hypothetical protein